MGAAVKALALSRPDFTGPWGPPPCTPLEGREISGVPTSEGQAHGLLFSAWLDESAVALTP